MNKVEIKIPDDAFAYYVCNEFGGIVIFTPKNAFIWRRGEGWRHYKYGADILYGKALDTWNMITKKQAFGRIKEIEKYGFEHRSKVVNYIVNSD